MTQINVNVVGKIQSVPTIAEKEHLKYPAVYDSQDIYFIESGNKLMPVAGPDGTPAKIVKTSAAWGIHLVVWTASRVGKLPIVPDYATDDPNEVFDGGRIVDYKAQLEVDGKEHSFLIMGEYRYLCLTPPDKTKKFKIRISPDDNTPQGSLDITAANFKKW